jgi:hypothetical protein
VRKLLKISPGTLQNLRINVRYGIQPFVIQAGRLQQAAGRRHAMKSSLSGQELAGLRQDAQTQASDSRLNAMHVSLFTALFVY